MNFLLLCITLVKIKTFSKFFGPFLTYIYILRWIHSSFLQQTLLFRQYSRGLRICINAKWLLGFFSLHNEKNSKYSWIFFLISCTFSILLVRLTYTFYSFQIYMAFSGLAFLLKKKNFDFLSRKKNPALTMGYSVTL